MTLPACWHYGYNSQYAVPTTQRGLSPYKMLFRGALAPTAPMVPPPMRVCMYMYRYQRGIVMRSMFYKSIHCVSLFLRID